MGSETVEIRNGDDFKRIGYKGIAISNQGEFGFASLHNSHNDPFNS